MKFNFGMFDKFLVSSPDLSLAMSLFLVLYLSFDVSDYIPDFLKSQLVRLIVIVLATFLLLRANVMPGKQHSNLYLLGLLLLLVTVLHEHPRLGGGEEIVMDIKNSDGEWDKITVRTTKCPNTLKQEPIEVNGKLICVNEKDEHKCSLSNDPDDETLGLCECPEGTTKTVGGNICQTRSGEKCHLWKNGDDKDDTVPCWMDGMLNDAPVVGGNQQP